ncbi:MAG: prolyl oligopeptidase family serine peptidase [bacterium]
MVSFELLLPWRDVHPYHPWISDGIGFNLRFVKAIKTEGRITYDVVYDECIGCERHPRHYALLQFEQPTVTGEFQTFVQADQGHIFEGDSIGVTSVTVANADGEDSLTVLVLAGEGDAVVYEKTTYATKPGFSQHSFNVNTAPLSSGGYRVKWQHGPDESEGETGLSILPPTDYDAIRSRLTGASAQISSSTVSTLMFKLDEVADQIDSARSYETCVRQRIRLTRLERQIEESLAGRDPYSGQTGFVRRAYRSEIDSTLQPYMVWVPDDYDPGQTYPLFVYLHGSASTEYSLRDRGVVKMIPEGFIGLAPRGRGTSNCFTFDHAQEDIAEAINAVITVYPIDTAGILLCGFSMGGYGVYRTFYETPEKFRGLAVFSGHPNLANDWYPGNDYPDFTHPDLLTLFYNIPMFVFHGERDRNAPYKITETLVTRLEQLGGQVEFHPEADKGHEEPGKETYQAYYDWVQKYFRE